MEEIVDTMRQSTWDPVDDALVASCRHVAAVALLLRPNPNPTQARGPDAVDILFLKRAARKGDPWSGDVCFPGGHVEDNETFQEAAEREALEEAGIDLSDRTRFALITPLNQRYIPTRKLVVAPFVFRLLDTNPLPLVLQESEIAEAQWTPLEFFLNANFSDQLRHRTVKPWQFAPLRLTGTLLRFTEVLLPDADSTATSGSVRFPLWGLTLRITESFLYKLTGRIINPHPFFTTNSALFNTAIHTIHTIYLSTTAASHTADPAYEPRHPPMDVMLKAMAAIVLAAPVAAGAAIVLYARA